MKRLIAIVILILFVFTFCINVQCAEITPQILKDIEEISAEYNLCPELIESIIYYESRFNPKAVNKYTGCTGLMQIQPKAHKKRMKRLGVTDLKDPYQNILVGCDYLSELFETYEDIGIVLMIYSEGTKGIKKAEKGKISRHVELILEMSAQLEEEHRKVGGNG